MKPPIDDYQRCRFSITLRTTDLAVVHCLRALCQFAEDDLSTPQIAWGGTGEHAWKQADHQITLRFTSPEYRATFVREASRLLPAGSWEKIDENNDDPAKRQREHD